MISWEIRMLQLRPMRDIPWMVMTVPWIMLGGPARPQRTERDRLIPTITITIAISISIWSIQS